MELSTNCALCVADVFHCHELSTVHIDGSSSCTDPWCSLPHHLHEWQLSCATPAAQECWCIVRVVASQVGGRRYTDTWWSLAS